MNALTATEQTELAQQEGIIERGIGSFVAVGLALMAIRDDPRKLYRTYGTFEQYCRLRWKMERRRVYQLIEGAQVVQNVNNCTQIEPPKNEAQARELAKLKEPEDQAEAWQRAFDESIDGVVTAASVKEVVQAIIAEERGVSESPPLPNGQYHVFYADPPWRYEHCKTYSREIENQYPTMSLDEICRLPIADSVASDAVLFLWATSPKLAEAMQVIEAWGFTYRTCMVWVKDKIGMGYYARQQHELLLIATRGSLPVPEPKNRPSSVIVAPRLQHSTKPERVYELIEQMYPGHAKLELFSRQKRQGWDSWGNQV